MDREKSFFNGDEMAIYDNLFVPLQIGNVRIKNRIVRSPHGTGLSGEDLISYHEARAKGGVAMSTIQATGVHSRAPSGIAIYSDDCVPFLSKMTDRLRPYEMKLFIQLFNFLPMQKCYQYFLLIENYFGT